jgi:hypothetical protein
MGFGTKQKFQGGKKDKSSRKPQKQYEENMRVCRRGEKKKKTTKTTHDLYQYKKD